MLGLKLNHVSKRGHWNNNTICFIFHNFQYHDFYINGIQSLEEIPMEFRAKRNTAFRNIISGWCNAIQK